MTFQYQPLNKETPKEFLGNCCRYDFTLQVIISNHVEAPFRGMERKH